MFHKKLEFIKQIAMVYFILIYFIIFCLLLLLGLIIKGLDFKEGRKKKKKKGYPFTRNISACKFKSIVHLVLKKIWNTPQIFFKKINNENKFK